MTERHYQDIDPHTMSSIAFFSLEAVEADYVGSRSRTSGFEKCGKKGELCLPTFVKAKLMANLAMSIGALFFLGSVVVFCMVYILTISHQFLCVI